MKVGELSKDEIEGIKGAIDEVIGLDSAIEEMLLYCDVGVVKGYMTDTPGWCGDIYFIVWPGSQEFVNIVYRTSGTKDFMCAMGTDEITMR